jgi:flagellar FliJ protein
MTSRRFHFKLEPVRALREQAELNAMKELADELVREAALRSEAEAAATRLAAARAMPQAVASGPELRAQQMFMERREREVQAAHEQVGLQEQQVELHRAHLEVASREREVLERLKDRRRTEHERAAAAAEQAHVAELTLARYRRPALGGGAA